MNLPRWSLRNPVTAGTLIVSLLVVGAISGPRLPLAFLQCIHSDPSETRAPVTHRTLAPRNQRVEASNPSAVKSSEPAMLTA